MFDILRKDVHIHQFLDPNVSLNLGCLNFHRLTILSKYKKHSHATSGMDEAPFFQLPRLSIRPAKSSAFKAAFLRYKIPFEMFSPGLIFCWSCTNFSVAGTFWSLDFAQYSSQALIMPIQSAISSIHLPFGPFSKIDPASHDPEVRNASSSPGISLPWDL